jgi:hypothetical protein
VAAVLGEVVWGRGCCRLIPVLVDHPEDSDVAVARWFVRVTSFTGICAESEPGDKADDNESGNNESGDNDVEAANPMPPTD